jgi:hypothetical protein
MSIYSAVRKAIYLSPNRLDLLHRRRGLSDRQDGCMVCAVERRKSPRILKYKSESWKVN